MTILPPPQSAQLFCVPTATVYTSTRMPMILTIVAIMVVALSGAVYFRTSNDAAPGTTSEAEAESSSGIVSILNDAEKAADAMEQSLGGRSATSEEGVVPKPAPTSVTPTTPVEAPAATVPASTYADGTYTKTGSYRSPGGNETITVSLTLSGDVITDAKLVAQSGNKTSQTYMDKFAAGYSALVTGKDIDSIDLTVVNGSSLTPKGFMDAVAAIRSEAII